ncbi:MAG: type 2 lanthipeptide synthetase LanM family protein [Pyrinomonadaceae bacterium]
MEHLDFHSSEWCRAATLLERLAALRADDGQTQGGEFDEALCEHRLSAWRAQKPFGGDEHWRRRLALDAMTEGEFRRLLGAPASAVCPRYTQEAGWLKELARAFTGCPASGDRRTSLPEFLRDKPVAGFLNLIEPLLQRGRTRVREGAREIAARHAARPFDPETVHKVLAVGLPQKLLSMVGRTLTLELNVARLQGELEGETPAQRFESFVGRLRDTERAASLLREYAVLARRVTCAVESWVCASLEFLERLCADWDGLLATFSPDADTGLLVGVKGDAGDSHRGGRSVMIAEFANGFRVVYKPRSLSVDVHFQELLEWLERRGAHPPFRRLKIVERGTHGWAEFVAARPCQTAEEVRRFYVRQGAYLALLYALEATDFHFENLIAEGEHPVLVDLESLFQPRVMGADIKQSDILLASQTALHSVLRVGLLPQRMLAKEGYEGLDVSGLGAVAGQPTPERAVKLEGAGTDEMRVARERSELPGGSHRPGLSGGEEANASDYAAEIIDGFEAMYRLLVRERERLLSEGGPIARFGSDEVRVIVRDTHSYGLLLSESLHPDLLRDALDLERFFARLWVGIEKHPYRESVIAAERADLLRGDVPFFFTRPDSRDLWGNTAEPVADFFDETGLSLVRGRVRRLDEEDLARQVWFIRASMTTLSGELTVADWPSYDMRERCFPADAAALLDAASAVGDRLAAIALRGETGATWFGLDSVRERSISLRALDHNLYEGLPGVALFLAHLGALTRWEGYTELARAALATLQRQVERGRSTVKRVGAFDGWGGVVYALTHLGVLWGEPCLLEEAHEIVSLLPALIEQDDGYDIVGGSAGCIGGLRSLYLRAPSAQVLDAAALCGERLVAGGLEMERGIGWITPAPAKRPPSGFSHGAAGIAWSLLKLSALTGDGRFRAAALAGIEYERSLFSPEHGNWLDQRDTGNFWRRKGQAEPRSITAWCYGAPGVGLALLSTLAELDDEETRAEIEAAVRHTAAHGFGQNHSLCHGDLGNIELLSEYARVSGDRRCASEVVRLAGVILESIGRRGWLCGLPSGVESPGLMTGLAGIGYGLLRLAAPERVPSVLTLAPP